MNGKSEYILGIETATKVLSVAIVAETQTVVEYTLNRGQHHEPHLMPLIEQVYRAQEMDSVIPKPFSDRNAQ